MTAQRTFSALFVLLAAALALLAPPPAQARERIIFGSRLVAPGIGMHQYGSASRYSFGAPINAYTAFSAPYAAVSPDRRYPPPPPPRNLYRDGRFNDRYSSGPPRFTPDRFGSRYNNFGPRYYNNRYPERSRGDRYIERRIPSGERGDVYIERRIPIQRYRPR